MTHEAELALFPLTVHLLPGGRLSLRIFEQRYLRMVKDAATDGRPFVMCMVDEKEDEESWMSAETLVTRVKIVDFENAAGGILGITVEGVELVKVANLRCEADGLLVGCWRESLTRWPSFPVPEQWRWLQEGYQLLLEQQPVLKKRYPSAPDDARWLALRWLEIIPIDIEQKLHLLEQPDSAVALAYLSQIINIERTH